MKQAILNTILAVLLALHPLQASSGVNGNTADYVIVGVGNAGGLMAKQLTNDKETSVIALHSGQNFTESFIIKYAKNTVFSVLPSFFGLLPSIDISTLNLPQEVKDELNELLQLKDVARPLYESGLTIPQVNAGNRQIPWVIALPLGGATSINAGAYCRGTDQLYSEWEAIAGPEWSVCNISTIYKLLENYIGKTLNPSTRGRCGPLVVRQDSPSKLAQVFTQAEIAATGTPFVLDYNDPLTPIGVSSQFQLTRTGKNSFYRESSATAFLDQHVMNSAGKGVNGRKLQVHFESAALRTLWDGNKAIGVEYVQDGVVKQVFANKGVIVCAGLRSSSFLMQSGIGPASLLTSLGIPIIFDNPNVGQGLADQPNVVVLFSSNPNDSNAAGNGAFSQIAWLPTPGGDPNSRQVRTSTVDAVPGITPMLVDLCQPKSRGSVSINSSNPLDPPVIDLGVLSDPSDLALYMAAFSTYIKNLNIQLQKIDPLYQLIYPDPAILDDPVALADFIRAGVASNFCFQSHCRMASQAQGGVVDSFGKVYGTQNLIIADNSINPQEMDGTPMATAYLIAANIARLMGF